MRSRKLKKLLFIKKEEITILGSMSQDFIFKASEIMKIYLEFCEKQNDQEIKELLLKKFTLEEVNSFFTRLKIVKNKIFIKKELKRKEENLNKKNFTVLTLNVCRNCNMQCDYCFESIDFRKMSGMMDSRTAFTAIDVFLEQCKKNTTPAIIFTGGEPLLNFKLITAVVEYLKLKGVSVNYTLKTNATLIDNSNINFFINNEFKIAISLDGCEVAHDQHRKFKNGEGTYRIVENVINSFIEKKYGYNVSLSGTITHQTIKNIDDSLLILKGFKEIDGFTIKPVMSKNNNLSLDLDDHYTLAEKTKNVETNNEKAIESCGIGIWHITIDIDGSIYPCYRLCGMKEYLIGNIFKNGLTTTKLHDNLIKLYNIEYLNSCKDCHIISLCKKGCYTDKLLQMKENINCFSYNHEIVESMMKNYYLTKGNHKTLPMI